MTVTEEQLAAMGAVSVIGEFDHLTYVGKNRTIADAKRDTAVLIAEVRRLDALILEKAARDR